MQIENFAEPLEIQLQLKLKVKILKTPGEYIMALVLYDSDRNKDSLRRCLSSTEYGAISVSNPFKYELFKDVGLDDAEQISYYEPEKKNYDEDVTRNAQIFRKKGHGLNPGKFLDLAEEGVYSFASRPPSLVFEPIYSEITYGNLLFRNQNIAISFGNNQVSVPRKVYDEIKEQNEKEPRFDSLKNRLYIGKIAVGAESGNSEEKFKYDMGECPHLISFSELIPDDESKWVLGLELLGNHNINVKIQRETKTYQILFPQKKRNRASTSSKSKIDRYLTC
ncbi:unnamed protein product [Albugo candida]|uniref:Uncharacterized protein n=1 Tax=Albugo candida TaxID=65357 RepID=A0A024FUU7_9STRA|nr:unnamed protein product [Albugo candida]|eukprot:CCI10816.1 unnamed protein product [Albugo candida]